MEDYYKYFPNGSPNEGLNFHYLGSPKIHEIIKGNPIVNYLQEQGLDTKYFSNKYVYSDACGGTVTEYFKYRDVSYAFICIENITDKRVKLESIKGCSVNGIEILSSLDGSDLSKTIIMPRATLKKGQSILIPICMLLNPIHTDYDSIEYQYNNDSIFDNKVFAVVTNENYFVEHLCIGKGILVNSIQMNIQGSKNSVKPYLFNPRITMIIDSCWGECSCPHVYFISKNKRQYLGEMFKNQPDVVDEFYIEIEENGELVIAELEDEITMIEYIKVKKNLLFNMRLTKGEFYRIRCKKGDQIEVRGRYKLICNIDEYKKEPLRKYQRASSFANKL